LVAVVVAATILLQFQQLLVIVADQVAAQLPKMLQVLLDQALSVREILAELVPVVVTPPEPVAVAVPELPEVQEQVHLLVDLAAQVVPG
jgi:hypothetical protein